MRRRSGVRQVSRSRVRWRALRCRTRVQTVAIDVAAPALTTEGSVAAYTARLPASAGGMALPRGPSTRVRAAVRAAEDIPARLPIAVADAECAGREGRDARAGTTACLARRAIDAPTPAGAHAVVAFALLAAGVCTAAFLPRLATGVGGAQPPTTTAFFTLVARHARWAALVAGRSVRKPAVAARHIPADSDARPAAALLTRLATGVGGAELPAAAAFFTLVAWHARWAALVAGRSVCKPTVAARHIPAGPDARTTAANAVAYLALAARLISRVVATHTVATQLRWQARELAAT